MVIFLNLKANFQNDMKTLNPKILDIIIMGERAEFVQFSDVDPTIVD